MNKEQALNKIKELEEYINSLDSKSLKDKVLELIPMVEFTDCEKPFKIGIYQVTQELYELVTETNPSYFKDNPQYPVENVSYNDIINTFLPKLNSITDMNFRLPTEYEWMLAAQVDNTIYSGSDNVDDVAIYNTKLPANVGSKKPNSLGIFDMSGNVWEWCDTIYTNSNRVLRGGSWYSNASGCRVALRLSNNPASSSFHIGFRVVL